MKKYNVIHSVMAENESEKEKAKLLASKEVYRELIKYIENKKNNGE